MDLHGSTYCAREGGDSVTFSQYHIEESARVAREAFRLHMDAAKAGLFAELYIWFDASQRKLYVAENKPHEAAQLATGERVPSHLTQDQLIAWVKYRTDQVPYLGGA